MNATFTGLHVLDDRLPDWSTAGLADDAAEMRRIRIALDDTAGATTARLRDQPLLLDGELARANLDVRIAEYESGFFHARNPALWTGEAIFSVVSLMIRDFAPAAERLPAIAARLRAIPAFMAPLQSTIGNVPVPWIARAVRECAAADGLFDRGLRGWLASHGIATDSDAAAAVMQAADIARTAFADVAAWLDTLPADADASYAVGEATFTRLLERGHFCTESPQVLLARALAELPVEQEKLAAMVAVHGGSWPTIQAEMAADHPTVDDYYATFQRRWDDCHRIATAHDAVTWEPWPIRYVPIPAWAREFAPSLYWLFYRSPAPFDPYTTYEYVVTPIDASMPATDVEQRLRAWNNSTITLNHVVHHGAVGHHVQNWHARHRARSRIGRIAATDCASRIAMFLGGSMAEGWACYATQLMEELGMCTPLERLSEQHTRVRMLARAITDIRLHLGLCTFAEAVQYYQDTVGMPAEVATAEATKNSMFPCTAIMYWLGTTTILTLREQVKSVRGAAFSLRTFHDELLSRGAIPVRLAATLMTESMA
ncbi:MAG: DUF885 family protein [Gemmatimonadota bacterium]